MQWLELFLWVGTIYQVTSPDGSGDPLGLNRSLLEPHAWFSLPALDFCHLSNKCVEVFLSFEVLDV